jgi:hypothetical protein
MDDRSFDTTDCAEEAAGGIRVCGTSLRVRGEMLEKRSDV